MSRPKVQPKVVVIVGPTASGKTALALSVAKRFHGEIISADSRQLYRGLNIGTAKLAKTERGRIPHHLIDIVKPDERFTAVDFVREANKKIAAILKRGNLPIIVGGTGLYVRALMEGFSFSTTTANRKPALDFLEIGLLVPRAKLYKQIDHRVDAMFQAGLEKEVRRLRKKYAFTNTALSGLGYRQFAPYFAGTATLAHVREAIQKETRHFAKRQMTWFRKEKKLRWVRSNAEAMKLVTNFLR